jgi:hypothetical protein
VVEIGGYRAATPRTVPAVNTLLAAAARDHSLTVHEKERQQVGKKRAFKMKFL